MKSERSSATLSTPVGNRRRDPNRHQRRCHQTVVLAEGGEVERIGPEIAKQTILVIVGIGADNVITLSAVDGVVAGAPTLKRIVAKIAVDDVVPGISYHLVVTLTAKHSVRTADPLYYVIAEVAVDQVGAAVVCTPL